MIVNQVEHSLVSCMFGKPGAWFIGCVPPPVVSGSPASRGGWEISLNDGRVVCHDGLVRCCKKKKLKVKRGKISVQNMYHNYRFEYTCFSKYTQN